MEDDSKIKITLVLILSLVIYLLRWRIIYYVLNFIYFILFGLSERIIYILITFFIIGLIVLAIYFYISHKKIERLGLVNYVSDSEYQEQKAVMTDYYIKKLKKHPQYEEVKKIAEKNHEERMKRTPPRKITGNSVDRFSNFVLEDSD